MATAFQVVELCLKYSKTIVSLFVFMLSLGGYGLYDFVETTETAKNKAIKEVAIGFQEMKIKEVTVKSNCGG